MVKCKLNSSAKRRLEHKENLPSKRPTEDSSPAEESAQLSKIIDLDDVCLDKIFMPLNIKDLFSVAVGNEWLRPAANFVYKRKFGDKKVWFSRVHSTQSTNALNNIGVFIIIYDFKTCLEFLRCFGTSITHLEISYGQSNSKRYRYVHQYVNEYCSESLVTLQFDRKSSFAMEHIKKPFNNVQHIQLFGCDLSENFRSFDDIFPHLRHLSIDGVGLNHCFIAATPTRLERLSISLADNNNYFATKRYNVLNQLLQSNHQLQSLTLFAPALNSITFNSLLDMIKENQLISELVLSTGYAPHSVNAKQIEHLAREHPLLAELDLQSFHFTTDNIMTIIRQPTVLKKFRFRARRLRVHTSIASKLDNGWKCVYSKPGSLVTLYRVN